MTTQLTIAFDGVAYPVVTCRDCEAPVVWAMTAQTSKPILLDVAPDHAAGNLIVDGTAPSPRGGTAARVRWARKDGSDKAHTRYTTHFATCPERQDKQGPRRDG